MGTSALRTRGASVFALVLMACGDAAGPSDPASDGSLATPDLTFIDMGAIEPPDGGPMEFGPDSGPAVVDAGTSSAADSGVMDAAPADAGAVDAEIADTGAVPIALRVLTFNTGTSGSSRHDLPPDDGYGSEEAAICDAYYGNGLSWTAVIEDTRDFFTRIDPDVVVFQEIFHPEDCPNVPAEARAGFVCETWAPGDVTVAQYVLGSNFQVMCHFGKPDKCAAINRRIGAFRGCNQDFCLEGMYGSRVPDCGSGSRVGRGLIDLVDGRTITLVNYHGSSGVTGSEQDCRERQIEQVFIDLGDGQPGANGVRNLVMGDLNTDPVRNRLIDSSARRWEDFVGAGTPFHFISDVGRNAAPTYSGLFNIDHVISDVFTGSCFVPGISMGEPEVSDVTFFDHKPIVCDLTGL